MKKFAIGCLIFIALIGIIFAVGMYLTSGITEVADSFFTAVQKKDFSTARNFLAEKIRSST